jgi:hypothetical protein
MSCVVSCPAFDCILLYVILSEPASCLLSSCLEAFGGHLPPPPAYRSNGRVSTKTAPVSACRDGDGKGAGDRDRPPVGRRAFSSNTSNKTNSNTSSNTNSNRSSNRSSNPSSNMNSTTGGARPQAKTAGRGRAPPPPASRPRPEPRSMSPPPYQESLPDSATG